MAKMKYSRLVSPKGTFAKTWITKASTKFQSDEEEFKTDFVMEDTDENREWCEKIFQQGVAEGKKGGVKMRKNAQSPFKFPEDIDEDDFVPEEGKDRPKYDPEVYKDKIFFTTKSKFKPGLIDAAKQELAEDVPIFGGDIGRIKFELNPYEGFGSGVSLRLVTAQLIEKNSAFGGSYSADTDGFDEEEDGFVGQPADGAEEEF